MTPRMPRTPRMRGNSSSRISRPSRCRAGGKGLFTGYYEPLLRGSRTRHGAYRTPVYGLPDDLVQVDLGAFRPEWAGEHITARLSGHTLTPYPTRGEIDAHPPPGAKVLFYGDDATDIFFMHIQGSGRARLDDGTTIRIAYAGQNGRPYTPIGRTLIQKGALTRQTVSMQSIRDWLSRNPGQARAMMENDQSFIFFSEQPLDDPSLGRAGRGGRAAYAARQHRGRSACPSARRADLRRGERP